MSSTATLSSFASSGTPRLRARVSPHGAVGGARALPPAGRGRVCRASTGDSAGSNADLSADSTQPVSLERPSEGAAEADRAVPDDAAARHPYESWSVDNDVDAADFSGSSDPAAAPYAPVASAEPPPPVPASMSPFLTLTFNVGFFSTVILGVLGVRKAARFFASIPDLPEEERLRRMADFCAAQMTRVRDMPEGPAREKELARLEKVREDIARQRKKFEAAELRRVEWNRRIRRLDETGAPITSGEVFSILEERIRVRVRVRVQVRSRVQLRGRSHGPRGYIGRVRRGERTRASTRVGGGAREGAGGGGGGERRAPGRRREMGQGVGLPRERRGENGVWVLRFGERHRRRDERGVHGGGSGGRGRAGRVDRAERVVRRARPSTRS